MRNTSLLLGPEVANKFLSQYMLKLKDSGYSKKFRTQIIKSAKNAFKIQVENDKNGIKPLFRDRSTIISDQKQRGKGRVDWWNKAHYCHSLVLILILISIKTRIDNTFGQKPLPLHLPYWELKLA